MNLQTFHTPRTSLLRALVCCGLSGLLLSCVPGGDQRVAAVSTSTPPASRSQAPPPPMAVPANRCLARVIVRSVAPGPELATLRLKLPGAEGSVSDLELRIVESDPVSEDLENLCVQATSIHAYFDRARSDGLVGKRREVELELIGNTDARHWWIHRVVARS